MNKRQRIAAQRVLFRQAIGNLNAVAELFGTEDGAVAEILKDLEHWQMKVADFERWVLDRSPLA